MATVMIIMMTTTMVGMMVVVIMVVMIMMVIMMAVVMIIMMTITMVVMVVVIMLMMIITIPDLQHVLLTCIPVQTHFSLNCCQWIGEQRLSRNELRQAAWERVDSWA